MWDVLKSLCFKLLNRALYVVVWLFGEGLSAVVIVRRTPIGDIIEWLSL